MKFDFDYTSMDDYELFLKIRQCPVYEFRGTSAFVPDEYASILGYEKASSDIEYKPIRGLFDYQEDIARIAIKKRKYAVFAECGYGKTIMILEFARTAVEATGKPALIVSPLMVCRQTLNEAVRWYGSNQDIKIVSASGLQLFLNAGTGIGITNYEAIKDGLDIGRVGALILDECFPPGTMIDTVDENGSLSQKRIENILSGDRIQNASGVDRVLKLKKRKVSHAVIVKAGKRITSSPNHPFFTQRGWVCAQDIEPGDSILSARAAMRMVQDGISPEGHEGAIEVLRSILLSEMAHVPAGTSGEGAYCRNSCQNGQGSCRVAEVGFAVSEEGTGKSSQFEPNVEAGSTAQGIGNTEEHEPQTFRAWWQWDRIDAAPEDFAGCTWSDVGGGVCLVAGPTTAGISNKLQARLGEYRTTSRYRGGWNITPQSEGIGCEENSEADFIRVEGVEILEQGHPELERFRDADGELYFYDIEAERHPSFSVNGLLVHNSSMLKSAYGAWGTRLIELGRGLEWKLCATGTPAPNDRIEFANHAVFLDRAKTVNEFLATYFINRGETQNRWELKPHALRPFYRDLADWSIFMSDPSVYGWKDNVGTMPPINVHIDHIDLTDEQRRAAMGLTGNLFTSKIGGIGERSKLSQIAKGKCGIKTNKPQFIRSMVDSWPEESTIIWCHYNQEQDDLARIFPDAASIDGSTPQELREKMIDDFKSGRTRILISKPKVMGFGLNLQICTRQVFSGIKDSFEEFHQAVKRSNRVGSTRPLNVHIPVTELEVPFIENVLRKAHRIEEDTREQELLFKEIGHDCIRKL